MWSWVVAYETTIHKVFHVECMYMYGWVPSLFTWNYHKIVTQLYPNKNKVFLKSASCWKWQYSQGSGGLGSHAPFNLSINVVVQPETPGVIMEESHTLFMHNVLLEDWINIISYRYGVSQKNSFRFFHKVLWKTWADFVANPIHLDTLFRTL